MEPTDVHVVHTLHGSTVVCDGWLLRHASFSLSQAVRFVHHKAELRVLVG